AAGTWMYIRRWTFPCSASGGATASDMMAVAVRAPSDSQPRTISPRRAVSFPIRRSAAVIAAAALGRSAMPAWGGPSVLQQLAEHQGTGRQQHQIERDQQPEPA